ncbi:MAG: metallophosphoesterase family protein [Euryarchaeota archaeon]|nr:metallophosphoesterase family protein [Euryarchaeota archaeon]
MQIVVSDMHIGDGAVNYPALDHFIEKTLPKVEKVIFAGDILDLWKSKWDEIRNHPTYQLLRQTLVDQDINFAYLIGNHDYMINQHVDDLATYQDMVIPCDSEPDIHITHGWEFDICHRYNGSWWVSRQVCKHLPDACQRFVRYPSKMVNLNGVYRQAVQRIHRGAFKYKEECNCRVIMGHTHTPRVIDDRMCDCGDWADSFTWI